MTARFPLPRLTAKAQSARASDRSFYDYKGNALWIAAGTPDEVARVVAHEMSHFLFHTATPYGWLLEELNDLETRQMTHYCFETLRRRPNQPVLVPAYRVAERLLCDDAQVRQRAFADLCDVFVHPWVHLRYLEHILEGEDLPEVVDATPRDALRALAVAEFWNHDSPTSPEQAPHLLDEEVVAITDLPAVNRIGYPGGLQIGLGARHVYEGIAKQLERRGHLSMADFSGGSRPHYWALWLLACDNLEGSSITSTRDYHRFRDTFLTIADLALFVPAGSLYGRLRRPTTMWYDMQPGWRFVGAMAEAKKLGWMDTLERDFTSYQEQICAARDWPAPAEFLAAGAALSNTSPEGRRHREACRIRLKHPTAFIDLDRDLIDDGIERAVQQSDLASQFMVQHSPLLYRFIEGEMLVPNYSQTVEEPLHLILNWFLCRFVERVALGGPFSYEDLLPREVRYERVFSNIAKIDDLVEIIHAVHPMIRPESFESIDSHASHA